MSFEIREKSGNFDLPGKWEPYVVKRTSISFHIFAHLRGQLKAFEFLVCSNRRWYFVFLIQRCFPFFRFKIKNIFNYLGQDCCDLVTQNGKTCDVITMITTKDKEKKKKKDNKINVIKIKKKENKEGFAFQLCGGHRNWEAKERKPNCGVQRMKVVGCSF